MKLFATLVALAALGLISCTDGDRIPTSQQPTSPGGRLGLAPFDMTMMGSVNRYPGALSDSRTLTNRNYRTIQLTNLTRGQVREVQRALQKRGAHLKADGEVGPATRMALIRFQEQHDQVSDGMIRVGTLYELGLSPGEYMPAE